MLNQRDIERLAVRLVNIGKANSPRIAMSGNRLKIDHAGQSVKVPVYRGTPKRSRLVAFR